MDISLWSNIWFANIFFYPTTSCLYIMLGFFSVLCRRFLVWCSPTCLILLWFPVFLVSYPGSHFQGQCHEAFPPVFSFRHFIVSGLMLKVLILSWFLCMVWDKGPISLFCMWISSLPKTICWRGCPFPICTLGPLVNDHLTVYVWAYFWALCSIPLVYLSIFMPVPYCFDYCNYVIYFEIRKCEVSSFVLSQILSAIWDLLWLHMNLRIVFSISVKYAFGILMGISFNL